MMLTPSTTSRFRTGSTLSTRPRFPLSLPVVTTTVSLRRMGVCNLDIFLEHLWSERYDLHEAALAQLPRHRAEDTRADRLVLIVHQDGGVPVETDVRPVTAPLLLHRPDDHRLDDLPLLHRPIRGGFLDRGRHDVPQTRVASRGSPNRV